MLAPNLRRFSQRQTPYYPVAGGLDQVTPAIQKGPGVFEGSQNFEMDVNGGAERAGGFERYDGKDAPSDASYWLLGFDAGTDEFLDGETVTGAGGATGIVLEVVLSSGSWVGNDAAGTVVLGRVSGTYVDDEALTSASGAATANGVATENSEAVLATHYTYLELAADDTRALIAKPAGSGQIRGVHVYKGDRYCWRNNAGATAKVLFKATSSGWVAQDLGRTLEFTSGGAVEVVEGNTITGATSAATAVVKRVILTSGTWAGTDAAGRFIVYSQTGTFQSETLNVGASTNVANIAGNSSANTLTAGGRVEAINANFFGGSATIRMYWVDGVGKAGEWDGATYVPIITGMATDTPDHIEQHRYHLFLSFPGGSVQNSGTGDPYSFTLRSGANELGVSDEVTALKSTRGGTLAIFARNRTWILYGSSNSDWELRQHTDDSGCIEWSLREIWEPIYFDDRGITLLSAVQAFGDFDAATISQKVRKLVDTKKNLIVSSCVLRTKNRVRWFCSDDSGITLTVNKGQILGITQMEWGKNFVVATTGEDSSGNEVILAGDDEGMVYQMEKGTSFDGANIEAWMQLAFWHYKTPRRIKRFLRLILEMDSARVITLSVRPDFDYGSAELGAPREVDAVGGGGTWDISNWDAFTYDTQTVAQPSIPVEGSGRTMGIVVYHDAKSPSYIIQGVLTDFHLRKVRYGA